METYRSGNGTVEVDWSSQSAQHTRADRDGRIFQSYTTTASLIQFNRWKRDTVHPGYLNIGNTRWRKPGEYERWSVNYHYTPTSENVGPMWWWNDETWSDSGVDNGGYNPNDWSYPGWFMDTGLDNQAIIDCLNRLNSRQAEVGVALGEVKETAELLSSSAINFYRNLIAAKHGRLPKSSPLGLIRQGNSQLLRWKFGWMPLGATLYDLQQLIQNGLKEKPMIIKATRHVATERDGAWNINGKPGSYTIQDRAHCGAFATLRSDFLTRAREIGIDNPLEVAWELVPLSFVWDWFMPVGSFLSSLTATAGLDFLGGYVTHSLRGTYEGSLAVCGKAKVELKHMKRTPWSSWPAVGSYLPYAKRNPFNLNQEKLATLGQLIAQRNV